MMPLKRNAFMNSKTDWLSKINLHFVKTNYIKVITKLYCHNNDGFINN